LAAADAVLTKPGALTVFEAIARGAPIIASALRPLMPQEAPTAAWIAAEGLGLVLRSRADIPRAAAFLRDEVARARARQALRRAARPHAAREIARALVALLPDPGRGVSEAAAEPRAESRERMILARAGLSG
ncbi:MAG TPA: hypothetical protein VHF22_03035, partial [Planctomycetota bacterium]|nr:hypothetical protein [Planctomycetota bacterium]